MAQISPGVLVLVFFVYGLAWFVMGLTVALESRRTTALPLASSLKYLAAFGILHSAVPWLDMGLLMGAPGGGASFPPTPGASVGLKCCPWGSLGYGSWRW